MQKKQIETTEEIKMNYSKEDLEKIRDEAAKLGMIQEGEVSLSRKFTEAELIALMSKFWNCKEMLELRETVEALKKEIIPKKK